MYLSRVQLDMQNRKTLQAFSALNLFHGAIETAFPGDRKRRLWRIDKLNNQYYLLIVSEDVPDMMVLQTQFGFPDNPETAISKSYDSFLERIENGSSWRFRVTANPTTSVSAMASKSRGKVVAHTSIQYQKEWLIRKGVQCGFHVTGEDFTLINKQWYSFRKKAGGAKVTLLSATFEGTLTVTDRECFKKALVEGIGREKAYGMGMMTIVR